MDDIERCVVQGDCLEVARSWTGPAFDFIYADPPYLSGRVHRHRRTGAVIFDDRFAGGRAEYLAFLLPRLEAQFRLLGAMGSMLVHLDPMVAAPVRVGLEERLGGRTFVQEVVWSYNSGGGSRLHYGRKHDTLLWFSPSDAPYFDAQAARVPYSATIAASRRSLFHPRGKVSGDVLTIPRPPNHAKEWTGFPTQKPLALLRFLVAVHTPPGGRVADFFCGSGTTLVAARMLGRVAFGCDASVDAVSESRERLASVVSA